MAVSSLDTLQMIVTGIFARQQSNKALNHTPQKYMLCDIQTRLKRATSLGLTPTSVSPGAK